MSIAILFSNFQLENVIISGTSASTGYSGYNSTLCYSFITSVLWHYWLGDRNEPPYCKKNLTPTITKVASLEDQWQTQPNLAPSPEKGRYAIAESSKSVSTVCDIFTLSKNSSNRPKSHCLCTFKCLQHCLENLSSSLPESFKQIS